MHHRLAQLGSITRVLDKVELVDDIHRVVKFGHAPEDAVQSQAKLPGILAPVSIHQEVSLADVGMRTLGIRAVVSIKRGEREAGCLCDLPVKRRLNDQPRSARPLAREGRRLRIPSRLRAQVARKVESLRLGTCGGHEHEGRDCAAESHQRTRRSAVWVNSLSSRLVPNRKSVQ